MIIVTGLTYFGDGEVFDVLEQQVCGGCRFGGGGGGLRGGVEVVAGDGEVEVIPQRRFSAAMGNNCTK